MESLERSSAVIDLGKRLVARLKLGDDEVAQWMAHVLAERIKNADSAPPEHRIAAQNACAELVLQLWDRRYSLPNRLRPLERLEPLLWTLNSLDATSGSRFRLVLERPPDINVDEHVEKPLDLAIRLDDAARILIQYLLATAAEQASDEAQPWIQSAIDAGADVSLEVRVVGFVERGLDRSAEGAKMAKEALKDKIQKLEAFASLATALAKDLREKHDLLTDEADDTEPDPE